MIRRVAIAFVIGTVGLVASDADAQQVTPAALGNLLAANVQAHYASATSWTAKVNAHYLAKAYNQTKDATGTAVYAASPQGVNLTLSGQTTFVPCSAPTVFFFLCGGAAYAPFTFQVLASPLMNNSKGDVLIATPISANAGVAKIALFVDTTTFDVRRAMLVDGQGNRNTFDFH